MSDTVWYVMLGGIGIVIFAAICVLNIRLQRARARDEARMTPEELQIKRKEDRAFQSVFRRGG